MNIDNWPLDRIMRLPDWCFGRRFPVSVRVNSYSGAFDVDISEIGLPEKCVVWEFISEPYYVDHHNGYARVALGDQLVADEAAFMRLEPLINGYGNQGQGPRQIEYSQYTGPLHISMRMPVAAAGRRLTAMAVAPVEKSYRCRFTIVVSSMPKEVPDWLISGPVKSLL